MKAVQKKSRQIKRRGGFINSSNVYNKISDVVINLRQKYMKYKDYIDPTIRYSKEMYSAYKRRKNSPTTPEQVNYASQTSAYNNCMNKCQSQCMEQGNGISQKPYGKGFSLNKNMNSIKLPKNMKSNPTKDPQIKGNSKSNKMISTIGGGSVLMRGPIA